MKVQIDNESKKWMTLYELPIAKDIAKDLKEEDIKSDVEIACHCITPGTVTIYKATAKIAGNQRVYNYYKDESGRLDVWIDFVAYINGTTPMFVEAGAYLSDIWQAGPETYDEIRNHMYIRKFTEQYHGKTEKQAGDPKGGSPATHGKRKGNRKCTESK